MSEVTTAETPESSEIVDTATAETLKAQEASDAAERILVPDVPLAELEGLPLFEQFMRVWGTPERARILWDHWYETTGETGQNVLDNLVTQTIEEHGLSEEEAKRRLAVEKYLNDSGPYFAIKFMENYMARQFRATRTLQPMAPRAKRKR